MNFWDTSALVALFLDEPHSSQANHILESGDELAVWWGTAVEFVSVLARHERSGQLSSAEVAEHLRLFSGLSTAWIEIEATRRVRAVAHRLLRTHPLRAADSLQLAAAITASEGNPEVLGFVCFDRRLNNAAAREGFNVLTPL